MNVLLIYPPYTHSSAFDSRAPAMSLLYLASHLEKQGHHAAIFDASQGPIVKQGHVFRYGIRADELKAVLKKMSFDFVGITCSYHGRWRFVKEVAHSVKMVMPNVPIAIGGLYPTSEWQHCLNDCTDIDCILLGEAEIHFADLINSIQTGVHLRQACAGIEGIAWRTDKEIKVNKKQGFNDELDGLAPPAWHLLDLKKLFGNQKKIFELPPPALPILSSRGCPNRCTFCNMYITSGDKWRARSAKNVVDEIEGCVKQYGVHNFYFVDDNFSVNLKRAKDICQDILARKLNIRFNFHNGLNINAMDRELVFLLKQAGCTSVCLAIESGSEFIRNQVYKKGLATKKIVQVFDDCKDAGIKTIAYFMVGAPGETNQTIAASKQMIKDLPMNFMSVSIFTPYPQTALYDECVQKGWLMAEDLEREDRVEMFSSFLKTPDFGPQDVGRWKKELYFTFITTHLMDLVKEPFSKYSLLNLDMFGKFFGMLKYHQ